MALLDSLTWHVMDATADDWESLEQILPHVQRFHGVYEAALTREAAFPNLRTQAYLDLPYDDLAAHIASHQKSGGYHPGVISVAGSGSLQFIVTAYFGITT